ncbi:MAG: hypothetical protein SCARUB_03899 [Candidatus Scalindua rubra]|uniref:DUF433 domain-containing protein n=1 Tax=Candidatus Scalindua rubra TaxID=1872076 RepID=A0A1E3X5P6_9BACT|nr:MAG: hypothetical protein SCARUB_03899 [Candidatus Scalindua rubra]
MFSHENPIFILRDVTQWHEGLTNKIKEDYTYGGHKMNEEKLLKRIVINPKIMLGKPVIKGTRLTVELIVEKVAYGETIENLKKDYPFLTEDDIRAPCYMRLSV